MSLVQGTLEDLAQGLNLHDISDYGAFDSMTRLYAFVWLDSLGAAGDLGLETTNGISEDEARRRLRLALWDSQRIDNLFPDKTFENSISSLKVEDLPPWPDWKKPRREMKGYKLGAPLDPMKLAVQLDGCAQNVLLKSFYLNNNDSSYIFRHFAMSAFTNADNLIDLHKNIPKDVVGSWLDTKLQVAQIALNLTRTGK